MNGYLREWINSFPPIDFVASVSRGKFSCPLQIVSINDHSNVSGDDNNKRQALPSTIDSVCLRLKCACV